MFNIILLTATERNSNLELPLPHVSVRLGNLRNHDVSASFCIALFLCLSFMVGILGSFRACWFRDPVYQPSMSASQSLVTLGGGNFKLLTEIAMSLHSYNQNPLNESVSEIENQLIEISSTLDLSECNASYTQVLAKLVQRLGIPVEKLTLAEFVQINKHCTDCFNVGIEPNINQVQVSSTKAKSLYKQHEIIGHSLDSFCLEPNEIHRACTKTDALELVRMLDDLPPIPQKTSRFNILTKSKQLIAKRVPYVQASQYQDVIVKFAGMEYSV